MCVPLLLQGKTNLVESYVAGYPEMQQQLLQVLDSWCDPGFKIEGVTRSVTGVWFPSQPWFSCNNPVKIFSRHYCGFKQITLKVLHLRIPKYFWQNKPIGTAFAFGAFFFCICSSWRWTSCRRFLTTGLGRAP